MISWKFLCERLRGTYDEFCFECLATCILPHAIFAISSSFHIGRFGRNRSRAEKILIARILVCFLICINIVSFLVPESSWRKVHLTEVELASVVVQLLAWLVHALYVAALITKPQAPLRGHPILIISYLFILVGHLVHLANIITYQTRLDVIIPASITTALHACYLMSLIPAQPSYRPGILIDDAAYTILPSSINTSIQDLSHSSLFFQSSSSSTIPSILATSGYLHHTCPLAESTFLSRLFFSWLSDFMKRCYNGEVRCVDEVFDLPPSLQTTHLVQQFEQSSNHKHYHFLLEGGDDSEYELDSADDNNTQTSASTPNETNNTTTRNTSTNTNNTTNRSTSTNTNNTTNTNNKATSNKRGAYKLARLLWGAYGREYMGAGFLMLLTDVCNLSSPILLNLLLIAITTPVILLPFHPSIS